jgi:hypothetical protein
MYRDHLGSELEEFDAARPAQRWMHEAYLKGYRVSDAGIVYGLHGKPMVLHKAGRYPTFQIYLKREHATLRAHKFAGFCFFGFAAFAHDVIYLSDDFCDFSRGNLALRPPAKIESHQIERISAFYSGIQGKRAAKGTARALADELGLSLGAIMRTRTRLRGKSA